MLSKCSACLCSFLSFLLNVVDPGIAGAVYDKETVAWGNDAPWWVQNSLICRLDSIISDKLLRGCLREGFSVQHRILVSHVPLVLHCAWPVTSQQVVRHCVAHPTFDIACPSKHVELQVCLFHTVEACKPQRWLFKHILNVFENRQGC